MDPLTLDSIAMLKAAKARLAADEAKRAAIAQQSDGLDPAASANVSAMLARRIEHGRQGVAQMVGSLRDERRKLIAERDRLQTQIDAERANVDTLRLLRRLGEITPEQFAAQIEPVRAAVAKAREDAQRIGARIVAIGDEIGADPEPVAMPTQQRRAGA